MKIRAEEAGIPVFQPERIRRDGLEDFRSLRPDLCVTAAFGQIISQEMLDVPPMGCINVHASLLPSHRGAAPIAHAILAGDEKAGVTTMRMDAGIDTGPMLLQAETVIGETETCGELTERLEPDRRGSAAEDPARVGSRYAEERSAGRIPDEL